MPPTERAPGGAASISPGSPGKRGRRTNTGPAAVGAAKPRGEAATAADQAASSTPARATTPSFSQSFDEPPPPMPGSLTSSTPSAVRRA